MREAAWGRKGGNELCDEGENVEEMTELQIVWLAEVRGCLFGPTYRLTSTARRHVCDRLHA